MCWILWWGNKISNLLFAVFHFYFDCFWFGQTYVEISKIYFVKNTHNKERFFFLDIDKNRWATVLYLNICIWQRENSTKSTPTPTPIAGYGYSELSYVNNTMMKKRKKSHLIIPNWFELQKSLTCHEGVRAYFLSIFAILLPTGKKYSWCEYWFLFPFTR